MRNLMVVTHFLLLMVASFQQKPFLLWRSGVSRMKYSLIEASPAHVHPFSFLLPTEYGGEWEKYRTT